MNSNHAKLPKDDMGFSGGPSCFGDTGFFLRQELRIYPGPPHGDGAPTWTIHDPVRHRFFRIGWLERRVMDHPNLDPEWIVKQLRSQGGQAISPDRVVMIRDFLVHNELVVATHGGGVRGLLERRRRRTEGWIRRLWHGWLFFRVPLWNPDPFLHTFAWLWRLSGHPATWTGVVLLGVLGLINTVRYGEMFLTTFSQYFSIQGWFWYVGAILAAKLVHELGHAATASRLGCRVPTMGVAFLLFWPVFYTDVSEAWLLQSRRQRLLIGAGGVMAELGLAAVASFLWPFLSEGPARSAMVLLAGVIWISTLIINLNPFMRFDGYFLLSDLLGMANLHGQAFAFGQWRMREWLFGWGVARPQGIRTGLGNLLTLFSYMTWIYRAILYFGFALLVYAYLFKVAGIVMLMAEVGWFIVRPVVHEMGVWWKNRHLFRWNGRMVVTLLLAGGMFSLLALVPWEGSVRTPAMARAGWYQPLFVPVPAHLVRMGVVWDQMVLKNQELMVFDAPDLDLALERVQLKITQLQWDMRHGARELTMGDNQRVIGQELVAAMSEREGLLHEQDLLRIRAPFDGVVKFIAEGLGLGVWVSQDQPLVAVMQSQPVRVEALISEEEIDRVVHYSQATFIPADPGSPRRELKVERIENQAMEFIKDSAFASTFGGRVATRMDSEGRLVPEGGCFRVWLSPVTPWPDLDRVIPGTVRFSVAPRTFLDRVWRPIWAALIRQTDF